MTSADAADVRGVVAAAFGADKGPRVADLVEALDAAGHRRASLVAEADGEVIGHVALSRSWIDAARATVEVLVLSPLSVRPDLHGQGIGQQLLAAAVAEAERLGAPAVFLEGDPRYYGPRGWAPAVPLGFTPPSVRIPDPAFQVVLLPAYEEWITGALVYCDPFWVFDCVGLRE